MYDIMFLVPLRPHQLSLLQPLDEPGVDGPHYTTVADRQQKSHQPGTSPGTNNEMFYKLRNISNVSYIISTWSYGHRLGKSFHKVRLAQAPPVIYIKQVMSYLELVRWYCSM